MSDRQDDQGAGVAPPPPKRPKQESKPHLKPKRSPPGGKLPPYNVVLLDDDDHTYDYVMEMLGVIFQYVQEKAFMLAREVDETGRVIVLTTHLERAELKRDQILGYGADPRMSSSQSSMRAIIEPAEG